MAIISGCSDPCEDCEDPFIPSEPFINLNFFDENTDSLAVVTILTFNGDDASTISYFVTRSSQYSLPLYMNEDSSLVVLSYTPNTEGDSIIEVYTDSLILKYSRELDRREDGNVQMLIQDILLEDHSFNNASVNCRNNSSNCVSSEANLNVYF